jgi:hypothetical protein
MSRHPFPRWVTPDANLREVAPRLYVGNPRGIEHPPPGGRWALVIDFCGELERDPSRYRRALRALSFPFKDGDPIPDGVLDRLQGPVLLHCAAGLSRSVSVAYAMIRATHNTGHREALALVKADPRFPLPETLGSAYDWVEAR